MTEEATGIQSEESPPRKGRGAVFWVVTVVVIVLGVGLVARTGQALWLRLRPLQEVEVPPARVEAIRVAPSVFEHTVPISGTLEPIRSVTVFPKMGGKVVRVDVQLGDAVHEGNALAQVESPEYSLQARQAEIGLKMAEEAVELAERSLARLDAVRAEAGALGVSDQEFEEAQIQVEGARTQRDVARLDRDLARQVVRNHVMTAPCDGRVTKVLARLGNMVGNEYPAFQIDDTSQLFIDTAVSARALPEVEVGQRVRLWAEGDQQRELEGLVSAVSTSLDAWTRRGPVEITVDNPDGDVIGNLYARGVIVTAVEHDAVVLPMEVVRRDAGGDSVQVAQDGHVLDVPVQVTGDADTVLAVRGVGIGMLVLVPGAEYLSEGEPVDVVRVIEADADVAQ